MEIDIDGFKIDISKVGKKIIYENKGAQVVVSYELNFPPYKDKKHFDDEKKAVAFLNSIKSIEDKITYK